MSTPRFLLFSLFFLMCSKVFSQDSSARFFQQLHAAGDRYKPITTSLLKGQILLNTRTSIKQKTTLLLKKQLSNGTPVKLRPSPVVIGIKSTCYDTSLRLSYRKDTMWLANDFITKTRDGNILIPGFDFNPVTNHTDAHLIKCTQQGDTLWSKSIQGGFPKYFIDVYKAFELADNSILLAGNMSIPMPYNGRSDLMLIRLTATGDLIWEKTFKTKAWDVDTTSGSIDIRGCKQDSNGNIYLGGDIRLGAIARLSLAVKMDLSGNIIWSNGYTDLAFSYNQDLLINGNKLTQFATKSYQNMVDPVVLEMDINSGNTLSITGFHSPINSIWNSFYANKIVKLITGNILLYGEGLTDGQDFDTTQLNTHCGWIEITPDLKFVKAAIIKSTKMTGYNGTYPTFFEDGSGVYVRIKYKGSFATDAIYATIKDDQIIKERIIPYRGQFISWPSNFLQLDDGGYLATTFFGDSLAAQPYFEFMRLHDSDTSGSCVGSDTATSFVIPQFYYPHHDFNFDGLITGLLQENQRPFKGVFNNGFSILSNCKQISFCDSFRLSVLRDTVCEGTSIIITIHKNRECGANPYWNYDTTAFTLYRLNDTTITTTINHPWQGKLIASINGCKLLQDSVQLTVLDAPGAVNLGPDKVLCPGNTVLLNAKKGYAAYTWQNGSTDSTFLVTAPGNYFVMVTDACGGTFSDTVNVSPHPPISFYIGADTALCQNQTLTITAPAGYIHYQWTGTNINNDTLPSISALPLVSSWYKVTVSKTPGCFAADSLYVTVKQTPAIQLGSDTRICAGQKIRLNAGPGFSSYTWSTGQQQQEITVSQPGSYSVLATLNGCAAYDTLQVLNVYPLPVFTLGRDTNICQGHTLLLSVNLPQATYQWSNQSTGSGLTIIQPGSYWLGVTQQGCSSSDTIAVAYTTAPIVKLGNDTSLCQGQTLTLNVGSPGASYTWHDGSTTSTFLVTAVGTYHVRASIGQCSNADTILINYIPLPLFTLGRDTFICTGQQLVLAPELNTLSALLWQDGRSTPNYTVTTSGLYSLQATNQCGSYADAVTIAAGLCNIEMPSAFSPNGDGVNEVFKVKYPFPVQQFSMIIYNRYGEKIFETNDIFQGWDGVWKGKQQLQGSYIWTINFNGINNRQLALKGTVTLIR